MGGANPSLVGALGPGNAILAHDNKFVCWVAKDSALYFRDIPSAQRAFSQLFSVDKLVEKLQVASRKVFQDNFLWGDILR